MPRLIYACTLLLVSLFLSSAPRAESLLLRDARVVDVENGAITRGDVLLRDGVIASLAPDAADAEAADNRLDLQGRYLIPGLWDMHVHFEGRELVEDNALLLPVYLAYGITGVREAASNLAGTVLQWRGEVADGERLGPRIFTAGRKFEGIDSLWDGDREVGTAAQIRAGMDEQQALGVDFIKITENTLQPELFLETVREARRRGLLVSSHVPLGLDIFELTGAGLSSIEHATYLLRLGHPGQAGIARAVRAGEMSAEQARAAYDDSFNQATADAAYRRLAAAGVAVTPTLIGGRKLAWLHETNHDDDAFLAYLTRDFTAQYQWRIERMAGETAAEREARQARYRLVAAQVPALQRAGVTLLAGSDSAALNTYVYPAAALHEELALFTEAGLSPLHALQAATINGARFMGLARDYGSVSAGRRADLVVLNRNPLADIRATADIHAVIRGGEVFDRARLDALLARAAARKQALDNTPRD
ncbi:amidohydrolase family protein [Parahaliea mediterranea]|uniref:Amidohydrolase family protein n=1 Tax=Parahaliea mediterranea TaxID=651086 RepID=A0A939DEE5_9GAMM|nr:amidohydrolase family protein [Parahaliea mediterranea]MBN7795997.1 amidohydrolase family protein [Parahaliea mediterranea]